MVWEWISKRMDMMGFFCFNRFVRGCSFQTSKVTEGGGEEVGVKRGRFLDTIGWGQKRENYGRLQWTTSQNHKNIFVKIKRSLQSSTVSSPRALLSVHSTFSYVKKYKQNFELNTYPCFKIQSMNIIFINEFIFNWVCLLKQVQT